MSRTFWLAVGAVGGIVAYRKTTEAAARARELGALGTAQVAAQTTSRLASRTAHGLGRLNELKARREGRLVIGSAEEAGRAPAEPAPAGHARTGSALGGRARGSTPATGPVVPTRAAGAGSGRAAARSRTAPRGTATAPGNRAGGTSSGPKDTAGDGA